MFGKRQKATPHKKPSTLWHIVSRALHLRERYIYTRRGTLRLRYPVTVISLLVAGLVSVTALHKEHSISGVAVSPTDIAKSTITNTNRKGSTTTRIAKNSLPEGNEKNKSSTPPRPNDILSDEDRYFQKEIAELMDSGLYGHFTLPRSKGGRHPRALLTDRVVTIGEGDSLGGLLKEAGIPASESYKIVKEISKHISPKHIKAGQDISMHFGYSDDGEYQITGLELKITPVKTISIKRGLDGFSSKLEKAETHRVVHAKFATIENSLFGSAAKAGIPKSIVGNAIKIYSWNTDFQRDIHPGDTLEVMYDSYETEDGYVVENGDLIYANLTTGGKSRPLYRYKNKAGKVDYFDENGKGIKKTLMKTPIDGARMTSGFGMRKHPVLGYSKMHKGVDFAAPRGTPIYASGDGVVEIAGRRGSYGNYVRIRHNSKIKTAYAHMRSIKKGIRPGTRVKQGQVIGYVGTTGRSTGPHLHYEVLLNNKQVNPMSMKLPISERLAKSELDDFARTVGKIKREFAMLAHGTKLASKHTTEKPAKKLN